MKILRLKIYQPHAHYRIPFTFSRRHTYPIPPYSTVIGLICNVMGIRDQNDENFKKLKDGLLLAIYGRFESMTREYVWFRNLSADSHKSRFGSPTNRVIDQTPEHPGGQIPTRIDVLEDVKLLIYIAHTNDKVIKEIEKSFKNPEKRLYPLHLGRAEDWIVFDGGADDSIKIIEIVEKRKPLYGRLKEYDYTWIPDPERGKDFIDDEFYDSKFEEFFKKIPGSSHLITSFYQIRDGIRVFEHIPVKLFEGGSFPFYFGKPFEFLMDEKIPLFFTKMKYPEGKDE